MLRSEIIIVLAALFGVMRARCEDRFWVMAKVNERSVTCTFDTGSDGCFLSAGEARILELTNFPSGEATTEDCMLAIGTTQRLAWFHLLPGMPLASMQAPPVLGWQVLKNNLLQLDAGTGLITIIEALPKSISEWKKIRLAPDSRSLTLEIGTSKGRTLLEIDTGDLNGVSLPEKAWREWRAENKAAPTTLRTTYFPYGGITTAEESWAKTLSLGPITLTETPVKQAVEAQSASCPTNYAGTLGMAALRRLDLIIDGAHGLAYVRSKNSPPIPYDHNRVATAFIPSDGRKEMIARVVKGGPGFRAGIRNGDSLLKVDGHDAADWKTEPTFYLHDEDPLGTQVAFTLQRGSKTFTAKVGCQQILGPVFDAAFGNLLKNLWVTNDLSKSAITVRLSPLEAEDYFSRGADLYNANFFERAITNFDEAIKLHSTNVLCYFGRGYCENRTGHFSAATFDLSEFLVSETNFLAAYQERGFAYSQLGNLAQAISDFSKCIDLASTNRAALVWALQSRAQAYWLQRDGRHAVEDMRRALEEDPQNTKSHR